MTLLVVVAHPDDEAFASGSMLLQSATRTRAVVVCATRGEGGELAPGIDVPPAGLGALREQELRRAATILGVERVEIMNYLDSGMSGDPPPGSVCAAPFDDLVHDIASAIERHQPSVVLTLDGSDGHRDHLRIRDAVMAAADPARPLYLHCLPENLMHAWLRHRAGDASAAEYAALPRIGTPDAEITTVIDTAVFYATRLQAIAEHRSQTSPFEGLPEDLRRSFLAVEHLRRVQPSWTGGATESELFGVAVDAVGGLEKTAIVE